MPEEEMVGRCGGGTEYIGWRDLVEGGVMRGLLKLSRDFERGEEGLRRMGI